MLPRWATHGISVPTRRPRKKTITIAIKKWGGRCLVSLPLLNLPTNIFHCMQKHTNRQPTTKKTNPTTPIQEQPNRKDERRRKRKKIKNTGAGQSLGVGAELGVRVELVERVQEEESQGETQTPNGVWVSPAPERKRKRKNVADEPTKQTKRERERDNKQYF